MISHTKEKRYQCQFCDVKFGRSDHRRRHEKTAHGQHLKDVYPQRKRKSNKSIIGHS